MIDRKWVVLILISAAVFLVGIDMTVLYTALPALARDLNASNSQKLWIINAYPLVMSGMLPGLGTLGDRVGHRSTFLWGLALFGAVSLLAAFATSTGWLVLDRALLAVGAALMMPATLSLLRQTFESDRDRAIAIGVWGSVASSAAVLGPIIGGVLLGHFWWGSVFLVNVPIVLVVLVLTPFFIPRRGGDPDRAWDPASSVLIMVALSGLTYALKELAKPHPDVMPLLAAVMIGTGFTALFLRRQGRSSQPTIDFALFRSPRFSAGVATAIASTIALIGVELALTQRLQLVQEFSPLQAGMFIAPISVASFLAGPLVGASLHHVGAERELWISLLVAALGLSGLAAFREHHAALQVFSMILFGLGAGGGMSIASTLIMISAPEEKAGMAASIDSVSYEIGGTLGVAIMGGIMTFVYTSKMTLPAGLMDAGQAKDSMDQALILAGRLDAGQARPLLEAARHSFNAAVTSSILAGAAILAVLGGAIFRFLKPSSVLDQPAQQASNEPG